ncbi:M48 family metalloprotease [Acidobacteria bacterium AH-259-A15]|nr:M48 family metalloprotease [Acidobacteria bacterium AH-259-A15]
MTMLTGRRICHRVLIVFSFFILTDCARNPVTGKRQIALISEKQEIAYGREAHPEIVAEFGRVEDPALEHYLNQVGQTLARVSHRPELQWHFTVVDVPVVNAFALPGGYIYFTREILTFMNNEAELAGVLGHEIGHVTARHAVSQISKAQLFGLGLGLGSIFSPTFYQLSDFAQLGVGLLFLKHGRDDERQSDQLGVEYMSKAGYDPRELSDFFVVFQQMREKENQSVPSWLSSHPDPPDRVKTTAQKAEDIIRNHPDKHWTIGQQTFLKQISGIVFGENPREGFQADGWFLHPDLRFRIRFPERWRVKNSKRSLLSTPPNGAAAIRLTLARVPAETSPQDYAERLARQSGIELLEGRRTSINGNPAFLGLYRFEDPQGSQLNGLAAFISFEGRLYEIVGLAPPQIFRQYSRTFENSLTSFSALMDRKALNVQPDRLRIRTARAGETLRRIAQDTNNPRVDADELSLLNRIDPDQRLTAGTLVKIVEAGRR